MNSRERVLRAIVHEEPDRVPVFEPYGVLPPAADAVLGMPCVSTSHARAVKLFTKMGGERYEETVRRDWPQLVGNLGFDAGPFSSGARYRPDAAPKSIGQNT